jgi:hypothetical protein
MATAAKKLSKLEHPPRGGQATMVEAIRQGLWEEMERDPTVFLIGEDVGAYGGAFKVTEGLIDHFGKERVIDTPISEAAIVGGLDGDETGRGISIHRFHFLRLRHADELRGEVALPLGREHSGSLSRAVRFGRALRTISLAECRIVFSEHGGIEDR